MKHIIVTHCGSPTRYYGPFNTSGSAQDFADQLGLSNGDYSITSLSPCEKMKPSVEQPKPPKNKTYRVEFQWEMEGCITLEAADEGSAEELAAARFEYSYEQDEIQDLVRKFESDFVHGHDIDVIHIEEIN